MKPTVNFAFFMKFLKQKYAETNRKRRFFTTFLNFDVL